MRHPAAPPPAPKPDDRPASHRRHRIARRLLPLPAPYVAPRTQTERRLAVIWRNVLGMDRVGIEDSYNDLGGDSLIAAVIFARIEDLFGIDVPMATIIRASTIAKLAAEIDRRLAARPAPGGEG